MSPPGVLRSPTARISLFRLTHLKNFFFYIKPPFFRFKVPRPSANRGITLLHPSRPDKIIRHCFATTAARNEQLLMQTFSLSMPPHLEELRALLRRLCVCVSGWNRGVYEKLWVEEFLMVFTEYKQSGVCCSVGQWGSEWGEWRWCVWDANCVCECLWMGITHRESSVEKPIELSKEVHSRSGMSQSGSKCLLLGASPSLIRVYSGVIDVCL